MDRIQKIIDINILEESSLPDILDELVQDIKNLSRQELMRLASDRLKLLVNVDAIRFYRIGKNEPFIDVPNQDIVDAISQISAWTHRGINEDIYVCLSNPPIKRDAALTPTAHYVKR